MPAAKKTQAKASEPQAEVAQRIRDRIIDFRRVPAAELQDNERNWRLHPYAQQVALRESLELIGIADALIAYHSERNGGALTLIDGHLRAGEGDDLEWPTLVTDLDDEEADLMLATLDPLAGLAEADPAVLAALLEDVHTGTPALEDLLRALVPDQQLLDEDEQAGPEGGPPEMELQAMEHYDYVVFLFRDALDWQQARERLELDSEGLTLRDGVTRRIGLGRVLDGKRLIDLLARDQT